MKTLLIDDEADKGWGEVLSSATNLQIKSITNQDEAIHEVSNESYDLIFLDLRFGEEDHNSSNIEDYGGYKILKSIKSDFTNKNFATPIIIITATNKAWNIFSMLENGADSFYIKEHPNYASDIAFSQRNYIQLKKAVAELIVEGAKRKEIWNSIISLLELSNKNISNSNIKLRIEEKLKIGYGVLFGRTSSIEKDKLLYNNEALAYIVFWSILEEVVKDSFKDNWDSNGQMQDGSWIFKNGKIFIDNNLYSNFNSKIGTVKVGLSWANSKYTATERVLDHNHGDVKYYTGLINLSLQVYALLLIYYGWDSNVAKAEFEPLNDYRNKVDFIHSSASAIFNKRLSENQNSEETFKKCSEMLTFLIKILAN